MHNVLHRNLITPHPTYKTICTYTHVYTTTLILIIILSVISYPDPGVTPQQTNSSTQIHSKCRHKDSTKTPNSR